jgi:hypothetical protein
MTRKDFQLIADTIDGLISDGILAPHDAIITASRFSGALSTTNDRFDTGRFYTAATKSLARVEQEMVDSIELAEDCDRLFQQTQIQEDN